MTRAKSQTFLKRLDDDIECREFEDEENEKFLAMKGGIIGNGVDDSSDRVKCITLHSHKRDLSKRGEDFSPENYGRWRQEQKIRAARLEKELKARWTIEELIEEQLNRYHSHYNKATVPNRPEDVAQLLMPKWTPPLEMATFGWLGDWRPSSILELLRSLVHGSSFLSFSHSDPYEIDQLLSQLIHDMRIEETVLDEEMSEIQATCILHLPFSPVSPKTMPAFLHLKSEFKKIERVIVKAQQLRFKALELVVKKMLSQTDAAEFLVAFAGIQDSIHQFADHHRLHKGPVSVRIKALGTI